MGILTRSNARWANSQSPSPEPAKSKPNKLQKKNPRQKFAHESAAGDAPVSENDAQSIETGWVEPALPRPRPTWASESYFKPRNNASLSTMRPLGQYPTVSDYKSAGLTPPTKCATKRAFQLTVCATEELGDTVITNSSTPITPAAEEATPSHDARLKAELGALSGAEKLLTLRALDEASAGEVRDGNLGDVPGGSLEVPRLEATGLQTIQTSLSPFETPVATPPDELLSDPAFTALTAPDTVLPGQDLEEKPVQQADTPLKSVADPMASEKETPVGRDFVAVLDSLPVPRSNKYDVLQLRQVLAASISHCREGEHDEVALALLHFWSQIADDEFKMSLIHNMGRKEVDHNLELAFQTMLRHAMDDAPGWYKAYISTHPVALDRQESGSNCSLASALLPEAEPRSQTFKTADIYRDTSGLRLEELFKSGKSNTAPLKRPRKPCPVNEKSFKRRREWEADPSLEQTLREKRARLLKETAPDPEESMPKKSAVRPRRGRFAAAEQPPAQPTAPEATDDQVIHQSVEGEPEPAPAPVPVPVPALEASPTPAPARTQRGGRGRGRGGRAKSTQTSRDQQAAAQAGPQAAPAQVLEKRRRELSLDTTVSAESELSNECYSDRENDWHGEFGDRQMPNSINPPDNSDNCYECDQGGNLLCCDTCENAFHFDCLQPPVDPKKPPQGEWFCPSCGVRNPFTIMIAHGRHKKRKTEFSPPNEIKDYFVGVKEGVDFDSTQPKSLKNCRFYQSVPHIPRLTKPPKTKTTAPDYKDEHLLKMSDDGHVILCNQCGRCTDNARPIIRCDYCLSSFHLDCLDPPLANPPNPRRGWMCPKHILPEELIVTKMVDGRVQERRPRIPKHTMAAICAEPIPYDDVNETTFDDDFREKRHLFPAGDMILDFISAVHTNSTRQRKEYFASIANTCINLAKNMVEEHLAQNSAVSADEITAQIAPKINEAINDLETGKSTKDQYDAALTLVGFAKGESTSQFDENDCSGGH